MRTCMDLLNLGGVAALAAVRDRPKLWYPV